MAETATRIATNNALGTSHALALPKKVVQALVRCGWLTQRDAIDQRLKFESLSQTHLVLRVEAPDGSAVIVKGSSPTAERNLQRELFVYRLAAWMPSIASVVPKAFWIDERHQFLVLESLGRPTNSKQGRLISLNERGTSSKLARSMASWHRATQGLALWPSLADGILQLPEALELALKGRPIGTRTLLQFLASDAELARGFQEARSAYRHKCLIHGDIRLDNWVLEGSGSAERFKVLDWEMAGSGDPAWDVGSACAEFVVDAIRQEVGLSRRTMGWPSAIQPALQEFIAAYSASGGLINAMDSEHINRVVLCTSARLSHVACEWAEYENNINDSPLWGLVEQARMLLQQRTNAVSALRDWTMQE